MAIRFAPMPTGIIAIEEKEVKKPATHRVWRDLLYYPPDPNAL
jgi:hypothetical protein